MHNSETAAFENLPKQLSSCPVYMFCLIDFLVRGLVEPTYFLSVDNVCGWMALFSVAFPERTKYIATNVATKST